MTSRGSGDVVTAGWDAPGMVVTFDAELWIWDARRGDSWTFLSLPVDVAAEVRDVAGGSRRAEGAEAGDMVTVTLEVIDL